MTCDEIRDLAPAYVLGALEADEERLVAEHLASCPEVHAEFSELGSVVPYLGEQVTLVEPPPALRQRIMAAAAGDLASRPAAPSTAGAAAQGSVVSLEQVRRRRRVEIGTRVLGIAAVLAIVALAAFNLVTQQQLNAARDLQARTAARLELASPARVTGRRPAKHDARRARRPRRHAGDRLGHARDVRPGRRRAAARSTRPGPSWRARRPCPWARSPWAPDGVGYFDDMPSATDQAVTVAITLEAQPDPPAPTTPVIAAGVAAPPGAAS